MRGLGTLLLCWEMPRIQTGHGLLPAFSATSRPRTTCSGPQDSNWNQTESGGSERHCWRLSTPLAQSWPFLTWSACSTDWPKISRLQKWTYSNWLHHEFLALNSGAWCSSEEACRVLRAQLLVSLDGWMSFSPSCKCRLEGTRPSVPLAMTSVDWP